MINNINFGIKISTKKFNLLQNIYENRNIIDYIEISLKSDSNTKDLEIIKNFKLPYAIHLSNSNDGIDFGDYNRQENNEEYIENINQMANNFSKLNPICYIVHPESGDLNLSISNIEKLLIKPIAIENMPVKGIHGENMLGYDSNSLGDYYKKIRNLEFCLDINHAIKASITLKKDPYDFVLELIKFKKPLIFHIAGGDMSEEIDNHLNLNEGNYDIAKIKKILLKINYKIYLTFEIPRDTNYGIEDDLRNMKLFINE